MNTPKLRFPGFHEEWEEKKLKNVCIKIKDGTHFSPKSLESGDYPYLTSTNVKNGYIDFKSVKYVSKYEHDKIYKSCDVRFGDVLLTKDGTIGQVCVNNLPFEFSLLSSVAFLRINSNNSNYFIYHILSSVYGQREIKKAIAGQALQRITLSKICDFYLSLPTLAEQEKIATFLSAVDEKIQLLTKKKTLLENYKKGVMQKIFSQQLRFKDDNGNNFPNWEEKKLGETANLKYGKDQKSICANEGKYPILGTGGIIGSTDSYLYNRPSVLIGRKGTIDKPFYMDTPFWTVDTLFYTEINENTFPKWLFYKFQSIDWYLYNEASGVPSLSASTISKIHIPLPSLPEQEKIANFLSGIDRKIELVTEQIERTKEYKRGLLQQMFV